MVEQYTKINKILSQVDSLGIRDSKNGCFKFLVYLNADMSEVNVDMLELSTRALNGLRRAGIHTIGELCERVSSRNELKEIRNLGVKSANEIMDHLFAYQYNKLPLAQKKEYMEQIIRINAKEII